MNRIRVVLIVYCIFLGVVIFTADLGAEERYWGWLKQIPMGDKIGHCTLIFGLCALANLAMKCQTVRLGQLPILLGTVIVLTLVLAEEFSQIWIPGRDFDVLDIAADLVGIGCGDQIARVVNLAATGMQASRPDCRA
jgi:hypothetical protein